MAYKERGNMNKYGVSVPIAGYAYIEVEADSEKEAIDKAFNEITVDDLEEWECYEHICEGNVLHPSLNDVEVDLLEENDE